MLLLFLISFNKIQNNECFLILWSRLFDTTEKSINQAQSGISFQPAKVLSKFKCSFENFVFEKRMLCCRGNISFLSQTVKLHRVAEVLRVSASYKYSCVYTGLIPVQIQNLMVLASFPSLSTLVFPTLSFLKDSWKPKGDLNKKNKLLLVFENSYLLKKISKWKAGWIIRFWFYFRQLVTFYQSWIFCSFTGERSSSRI